MRVPDESSKLLGKLSPLVTVQLIHPLPPSPGENAEYQFHGTVSSAAWLPYFIKMFP